MQQSTERAKIDANVANVGRMGTVRITFAADFQKNDYSKIVFVEPRDLLQSRKHPIFETNNVLQRR